MMVNKTVGHEEDSLFILLNDDKTHLRYICFQCGFNGIVKKDSEDTDKINDIHIHPIKGLIDLHRDINAHLLCVDDLGGDHTFQFNNI